MFADTATLYPISYFDWRSSACSIWSGRITCSPRWERVLVEYKGLPVDRAQYFCDCIRKAFPTGRVPPERYQPLVASRTGPDPDDHVQSAAAVAGGATVLLSADRRGYPPHDTAPARRRDPDAYFSQLLKRYPDDVLRVVDEMGSSLLSRGDVIRRLDKAGLHRSASTAFEVGRLGSP